MFTWVHMVTYAFQVTSCVFMLRLLSPGTGRAGLQATISLREIIENGHFFFAVPGERPTSVRPTDIQPVWGSRHAAESMSRATRPSLRPVATCNKFGCRLQPGCNSCNGFHVTRVKTSVFMSGHVESCAFICLHVFSCYDKSLEHADLCVP